MYFGWEALRKLQTHGYSSRCIPAPLEAKVAPYHHLRDVAHLLLPSAPFPADDGYDPAPPIRFLLALHLA